MFRDDAKHIPIIYGSAIALALILYLFIMMALGLAQSTELRLFNVPIYVAGVFLALRQYKNTHDDTLRYFNAMITGTATSFVSATIFALFIFIYLKLSPAFMSLVVENAPLGDYLNPYLAAFAIWFEGLFSGYSSSYLIVNWMHTDKVEQSLGSE